MNKVPKNSRTWRSLRNARKFIQQANLTRLPVNPFDLYKQFNWVLFSLSQAEKLWGKKDPLDLRENKSEAVTVWNGEQYLTIYDDSTNYTFRRIRWTLAHEIGHIILNHHLDFDLPTIYRGGGLTNNLSNEQYKVLEKEAHYFAKELLAPIYVLKRIGIVNKRDISRICYISSYAAENTEFDIKYHSRKDIYLECSDFYQTQFREYLSVSCVCTNAPATFPLSKIIKRAEVKIVSSVWHTLEETNGRFNSCPRCGHNGFSEQADYCMICGLYLFNTCSNDDDEREKPFCGAVNPVNARFCESCGCKTQLFREGLLSSWDSLREWQEDEKKSEDISDDDLPFKRREL